MRSHHIIALQENTLGGKDYIIGDVHGDLASFTQVLADLTPNDRLFSVGDLTDRGAGSADIVPLIQQYQQQHPDRLYVVCGNHEEFCLNTIKFLEEIISEFDEIRYRPDKTESLDEWLQEFVNRTHVYQPSINFKNHMASGGEWLVRLFKQELYDGDITVVPPDEESSGEDCSSIDESYEVIFESTSKIGAMKAFMETLPYIILVEGERPFTIAHADNIFDMQALKYRIENEIDLTAGEISYVLNARETKPEGSTRILINPLLRNIHSILSYNGHNIVAFGKAAVVRYLANAVNTDVASFLTGVALRVNHTDGTCEYIGANVADSLQKYPKLKAIQEELTAFLQSLLQKKLAQEQRENVPSPVKSAVLERMKEEHLEKREPLSPSKRAAANLKRERDEDQKSRPATPKNSPSKNGMQLFSTTGASQRKLFDDEQEPSCESPSKRKG